MIINGKHLLDAAPIKDMIAEKRREHGVSYGLTEAGYDIRLKQPTWLSSAKRFTLASTIEEFDMPKNLVGVVHDKSTWARQGLSVFSGTVIEPAWRGFLTLELAYWGDKEIYIPAGAGIAQVLFSSLISDGSYGDGKYQGQADQPVGARFK